MKKLEVPIFKTEFGVSSRSYLANKEVSSITKQAAEIVSVVTDEVVTVNNSSSALWSRGVRG